MNDDIRSAALRRIRPSATIAMTRKASELRAAGRTDVIALSSGEPDLATPENVREAAIEAIRRGESHYPPVAGIAPLRAAVRDKFARENDLAYGDSEVIVSSGAKQVIANAFLATLDPGDEVVIPEPFWGTYQQLALLCGARPVTVATREEDGFRLDPRALAGAIGPRTRWLVLNNPCNPSGAAYDETRLRALAEVLLDHPHVWLLSDDIYEHVLYDEASFQTMAAVEPRLKPRTLTVNGVSKAYAMTGWRIGYAGGPAAIVKAMESLQSQISHGANQVGQWAAVEALSGPQDFVAQARETFARRRDLVTRRIETIDGLSCRPPAGAFYLYVGCGSYLGRRSPGGRQLDCDEDFCVALLEEAGVAVVPGAAFGRSPYFRLSFAASTESLREAGDRLAAFCASMDAG